MAEASRRSRAAREGNVGKGLEEEDSCTTRDKTLPNDRARQDIEHEDADDAARDGSNIISNETGNELRTLSLTKNTVSQGESGLASRTGKEGMGLSGRECRAEGVMGPTIQQPAGAHVAAEGRIRDGELWKRQRTSVYQTPLVRETEVEVYVQEDFGDNEEPLSRRSNGKDVRIDDNDCGTDEQTYKHGVSGRAAKNDENLPSTGMLDEKGTHIRGRVREDFDDTEELLPRRTNRADAQVDGNDCGTDEWPYNYGISGRAAGKQGRLPCSGTLDLNSAELTRGVIPASNEMTNGRANVSFDLAGRGGDANANETAAEGSEGGLVVKTEFELQCRLSDINRVARRPSPVGCLVEEAVATREGTRLRKTPSTTSGEGLGDERYDLSRHTPGQHSLVAGLGTQEERDTMPRLRYSNMMPALPGGWSFTKMDIMAAFWRRKLRMMGDCEAAAPSSSEGRGVFSRRIERDEREAMVTTSDDKESGEDGHRCRLGME